MKMNILILANMPQRLTAQCLLCDSVKAYESSFNFIFITNNQNMMDTIKKHCKSSNIFAYNNKEPINHTITNHALRSYAKVIQILKKVFKFLKYLSLFEIYQSKIKINELKKYSAWMNPYFDKYKPEVVLVNGDRHWGLEPAILKQCKERRIPVIVPEFTGFENIQALLLNRSSQAYFLQLKGSLLKWWLYLKMPNQFYDKRLFYTVSTTIALNNFGTLSKNPWQIGHGLIRYKCISNQLDYQKALDCGIACDKLVLVGDVSYDKLYNTCKNRCKIKHRLVNKYNLVPDKKHIICALPQLFEHGLLKLESHWKEIFFLIETLEEQNHNLLLSLHPKMDRSMYAFLESKYDCKIFEESLDDVISMADLFVSGTSSTVLWAVLSGIESVVFDFYGINNNIFNDFDSMDYIKDKKQFAPSIKKRLNVTTDFKNDWKKLGKDEIFDGNTIKRYSELIKSAARK